MRDESSSRCSVVLTGRIREGKAPSKNELKRLAKQAEKDKKAAEKAAKQAELKAAQAAADVVRSW